MASSPSPAFFEFPTPKPGWQWQGQIGTVGSYKQEYYPKQSKILNISYLYKSPMATKFKYTRVRQEDKKEDKPDTDILMRFCPSYGRYVTRALTLFFGEGKSFVTIKAADRLMDKALWVAEVLKRRVSGLHQIIEVTEREIVDVYEPKEEGLVRVEQKRFLTIIEVVLTKEPTAEQKKSPGYQAPVEGKQEDYLTKQKWATQEAERKERIATRGERRPERAERPQGKRDYEGKRESRGREERGGERTRGRRN